MTDIPPKLHEWVAGQLEHCAEGTQQAQTAAENTDQDAAAWVIETLSHVHRVVAEATRTERALTAWAIQTQTVGASKVATATGVSISTAMTRGGQTKAVNDLNEIFGR
jgi:uncharacterized protein YgbK (DUF1537 family)